MGLFDDWLWNEYQKFAHVPGTRRVKSQAEFARHLGVTTGSLSRWLNGDSIPTYENVIELSNKLGDGIYSVTEYDPPRQVSFSEWMASMPPENRSKFFEAAREIDAQASATGIEINSPDGAELVNDVLRKYGL